MTQTFDSPGDFFFDEGIRDDPYPFYDLKRGQCPIAHDPVNNILMVTGLEEASEIYRDNDTFWNCVSITGPFAGLDIEPGVADDVTDLIEAARPNLIMNDYLFTMDPPEHAKHRALMMRLFTPERLHEHETFMERLTDELIDEFIADGRCEFLAAYAQTFSMRAILDVLGLPDDVHHLFRERLGLMRSVDGPATEPSTVHMTEDTFGFISDFLIAAVEERRREPRGDVLSVLATATFRDGSTPEVMDVVRSATLLFQAGHATTTHLLATALKILAEDPDLQERLRSDEALVAPFVEEALRIESPLKSQFRVARKRATVGGVDIPAGSILLMLIGGANRDPRHFECPAEFRLDRPNGRAHIAFGRGAHSCPGGPLARAEARVSVTRILQRMHNITLSEAHHGTAPDRQLRYDPLFVVRGLQELHLEFTPTASAERPKETTT